MQKRLGAQPPEQSPQPPSLLSQRVNSPSGLFSPEQLSRLSGKPPLARPLPPVDPNIEISELPFVDGAAQGASLPRQAVPGTNLPLASQRNMPSPGLDFEPAAPASPSPYTPMPEYVRSHQHGEKMGLGERIMHALKSAGMGFMRGGVGGAAAGAIGGAVDPEFWHRAQYQYQTLPLWQQRFENEAAVQGQKRADLSQSRQQGNFERQMRATEASIANQRFNNDREADRQAETARQNAFNRSRSVADQRKDLTKEGGEFVDSPSALLFGPKANNQGNIIPSLDNRGFYRMPSVAQSDQRKLQQVTNEARARAEVNPPSVHITQTTDDDGNVIKVVSDSKTGETLSRENLGKLGKSKTDTESKQDRQEYDKALVLVNQVQRAINKARSATQKTGVDDEAAWESARDLANQAMESYPGLIEVGGLEEGQYPYIKMKGSRPAKPLKSSSASKPAKDISSEVFEHGVKTKFGGDRAAAIADLKRRGYTVGGQQPQ